MSTECVSKMKKTILIIATMMYVKSAGQMVAPLSTQSVIVV
jgi:hypothetical protein